MKTISQQLSIADRGDHMTPPLALLTPTQRKVLGGVYSGQLNKQIAFDLGIAEATVKAHMTALMRKMKVHNRTQLAIAARSLGWSERTAAH